MARGRLRERRGATAHCTTYLLTATLENDSTAIACPLVVWATKGTALASTEQRPRSRSCHRCSLRRRRIRLLPHAEQDPDGSDAANDPPVHSQSERVGEDDHDQK